VDQSISVIAQVDVTSSGGGLAASSPGRLTDPLLVSAEQFAAGRVDLSRVTAAVRHMVGSVEPSRMFSELAQVCVPAISDACTIDLVEEGGHRYRIRQPAENPYDARGFGEHDLAEADFASDGAGGPRFSGVLVCTWFDGYRPGEADSALLGLLVDHTTALVEHERLTARVDELQTAPENAALLLPSHQRVAAAVGILMVLHHLTAAQATDLLTRASQHTHLSVRGVADTVLRTGAMPDHPHPAATTV
jgi:ANTAR domain